MQVFNVGVLELLFILIIAFIVLGPRKAIRSAGEVGRWIKNFTKSPLWREIISTSNEIRDLPNKLMEDAELKQTIEDLDYSAKEINKDLNQLQIETNAEIQKVQQEINQGLQNAAKTDLDEPSEIVNPED